MVAPPAAGGAVDRGDDQAGAFAQRGDHLSTVAAIDESTELIVGFTELVVPGNGKGDAQHYGTAVLTEHRGHGLALWMKAETIRQATVNHPDLSGLLTDTADTNIAMQRVNTALGYAPTHCVHRYRLDV